jgi:hypothetical protein
MKKNLVLANHNKTRKNYTAEITRGANQGIRKERGLTYQTGRKSSIRAGTERLVLVVCENIKSGV